MNTKKEINAIFNARKKQLTRSFLIDTLQDLQSDEFDSSEAMYLETEDLILQIIDTAFYYRDSQTEEA